ncbi:DoxX family protein [Micromonospora arborensis]|uniref:DoxX family protein n=1 Tax=Micromonospora arborensis TaxID=2116518 RepID=UPI0033E70132
MMWRLTSGNHRGRRHVGVAAAIGLVLVQVGGAALHLSRGEARQIGLNIVLLATAAVTAWLGIAWL